jgi:hypothetical protein
MIITTNRYVVRAEYAAKNQEHIRQVMEDLRALRRTVVLSPCLMLPLT